MGNHQFSIFFFLSIFFITSIDVSVSSSSCPVDFSYVKTTPWDKSGCQNQIPDEGHCCVTLLSLFGMGISQHLRESSMFQLANANVSSACLSDFQAALPIQPSLIPTCFENPNQFVANESSCVGIFNTQDWVEILGPITPLHTACKGDVSGLTQCSSCVEAGQKVSSQLSSINPNSSSKCFYFTCLYAAAIANEFGPLDPRTASCILGLPLSSSVSTKDSKGSSKNNLLKLVTGFLGGFIGCLVVLGVVLWYRKRRKVNALHREYVSNFRASVLPNSGAKWFDLSELERATNGFLQRNFIGQGTFGVVYKGVLADGTVVAVKQMQDSDSQGDEEFSNEVEIISKIRHRNLLSLRGCCVSSDYLQDWAWMLAKSGKIEEIFDESIREEGPKGVMERFVLVGILCAHVMVAFRPTIGDALKMLEGDIDIPKLPDRPMPLSHESFRSSLLSSTASERSRTSFASSIISIV
ncbi:Protein kinase superfamily protein [Euphorbia peplus]|nr:Protein kinase superfamily protein [Euphorbia peplus]